LLYYAKHEKDKDYPSGIIPLVRSNSVLHQEFIFTDC
jgi:hypothetical protein